MMDTGTTSGSQDVFRVASVIPLLTLHFETVLKKQILWSGLDKEYKNLKHADQLIHTCSKDHSKAQEGSSVR
jgi:hypothetical protein